MNLDPSKWLESMGDHYARFYAEALQDLLLATVKGDRAPIEDARKRLGNVISETMGVGEVVGAMMMLRQAAAVLRQDRPAMLRAERDRLMAFEASQSLLPSVTFREALDEMVGRVPVTLKDAAERTAGRIAYAYGQGRVLSFVNSADEAVTERVKELLVKALREGVGEGESAREIRTTVERVRQETEPWSDAYARMAFRTNVNTAVTAGRFRQAQDQDIRDIVPCFRFDAVGDGDTRDNHRAANGLVFRSDNPVWNKIAPPLGYNCRCQVSSVSVPMLRRAGRISKDGKIQEDTLPASVSPDAGFRHTGRPDLFITT